MGGLLKAYRRKQDQDEPTEVVLPLGVRCDLREWGTPMFWDRYYEAIKDLGADISKIDADPEADKAATLQVLAEYVVAGIWDADEFISDTQEKIKILSDPLMWELRRDIVRSAQTARLFREEITEDLAGNSPPSSSTESAGGGDTASEPAGGQT